MSQHWHAHWANESFEPKRLRNWEVPNWHPSWPDMHSYPTVFESDNKGHILAGIKKSEHSPWGKFKSTWELPLKINRRDAEELSSYQQNKKKAAWRAHQVKHRTTCKGFNKTVLNEKGSISVNSNSGSKVVLHKDPSIEHGSQSVLLTDQEKVEKESECLKHYACKV